MWCFRWGNYYPPTTSHPLRVTHFWSRIEPNMLIMTLGAQTRVELQAL